MNSEEAANAIRRWLGNLNKEEIIEKSKEVLKRQGYIILDEAFPKSDKSVIETAIPSLTESNEYMLDITPYEKRWIVKKNPAFKKQGFWGRRPFIEKIVIVIFTVGLTLTANWLISKLARQSQSLKDTQQDSLIKDVGDSLKGLQRHLKGG